MKIHLEIDEATIKKLLMQYIADTLGSVAFNPLAVKIETKSKQNYRSEWETAAFRATYEADT